ncbi:MAG: phosphoribosylaminoimidazolesuccinocarboxamide synthase [Chitinophagales bacterium]|nr:phosphoribosylaminoimidazolesuccinocarboxamide synthase [Bacteroidota bacterium]MBP9188656.1 phosphoribosylaminoimidazolesuccinocarboxamide synthase [Chitinophagales bacterium]
MSAEIINNKFKGQTAFYKGKVRDVYTIQDTYLVMIASDRISAFDVVLPKPIPYKGQVLNQIAAYFLNATKNEIPNWLLSTPDPRVSIGIKCEPYKVEMVIRGYLSGHAWREYKSGKRIICGVAMPENMQENDAFPEPIITPTTKASEGHDEDISREEIIATLLVSEEEYKVLEEYTRKLFAIGSHMANERGLILVDTKYEFGKSDDRILLMDEIHTPDSSRYFYKEGYAERQKNGEAQKQLSKEFVREWLIENNFMGKEGQVVPEMTEAIVQNISERYIELFELVTGNKFVPSENTSEVVEENINAAIAKLSIS